MPGGVYITRRGTDVGVNTDKRVYVTGPHFGADIFSSTEDREKATVFPPEDASRYLALGKWRGSDPRIEPVS